jgi:hypothetical protein
MPLRKRTKKKLNEWDKYKKAPWNSPKGLIFVSPDGGETVYIQKKNGDRGKMVSQSQLAKDIDHILKMIWLVLMQLNYVENILLYKKPGIGTKQFGI